MERAVRKLFRGLQQETGKAVTGHMKGKVPDTSPSLIVVYWNYMFKYSTTVFV